MYLEGEVDRSKSGKTTINTRRQFSFDTSHNCRQKLVCTAVPSLVHMCGGELQVQMLQLAVSVLAWTISWLGFGLSDQLLLVRYPWSKMRYTLFGYLA